MKYIVIGAGAAGLSSAILLAKRGFQVHVFETSLSIQFQTTDSYVLSVTARGLSALAHVSTETLYEIQAPAPKRGKVVRSKTAVFETLGPCNATVSTSRAKVVHCLFEEAQKYENINISFGCKLVAIDFERKDLRFQTVDSKNEEEESKFFQIDASDAKIIASDGCWSKVRELIQNYDNSFEVKTHPWRVQFRVLFSEPGEELEHKLELGKHHIFVNQSTYCAMIDEKKFAIILSIREDHPNHAPLLSDEATEENVQVLKSLLEADLHDEFLSLIPEEEYSAFFSRKKFSGQVVQCNRLNFQDWILLLGDAAHSVLPATGEGINSALEDAAYLGKLIEDHGDDALCFEKYNEMRLPDVQALGNFALYQLEGLHSTPHAKYSRLQVRRVLAADENWELLAKRGQTTITTQPWKQ